MVKKAARDAGMHEDVSRLYRRAGKEFPPARLDDTVLNAARAALAPPRPLARSPFSSTWAVPASVAAVLMLSVTLVVFMSHERAVHVPGPLPASTSTVTTETSARDDNPSIATAGPITPQAAPPEPVEPIPRTAPPVAEKPKTAPARPPTPSPNAGNSVFETLKLFGKTAPVQGSQSGEASVSAVAPLRPFADIVSVEAKGRAGAYDFTVRIQGAGNDCSLYVDRWEVLSEDGRLLYRRVLSPRDAKEQSVAGSGGPVRIEADTIVWVRVHTYPAGYAATGFKGSPRTGFRKTEMQPGFATEVAKDPPPPGTCS